MLQHHSAYFRTLFAAFTPLREVVIEDVSGRERKRQKSDEKTATEADPTSAIVTSSPPSSVACEHSALLHCVHLPDQVGRLRCSEEEFLLFLRHLYFCHAFCCPPLYPLAEKLYGLSDATPLSLTHLPGACADVHGQHAPLRCVGHYMDVCDTVGMWIPAVITAVSAEQCCVHYVSWNSRWDEWLSPDSPRLAPLYSHWDGDTTALHHKAEVALIPPRCVAGVGHCACKRFHAYCRPLLSLFDYFDCQAMLQRCDVVMAAEVPVRVLVAHIEQLVERLEDALTYRLSCTRERCLAAIKAIPQDKQRRRWIAARASRPLFSAASRRREVSRDVTRVKDRMQCSSVRQWSSARLAPAAACVVNVMRTGLAEC